MEHLIKRLEKSVAFAETEGENMDDVSWGMQEGILISYNEAKAVIEAMKAFKISSKPVLADVNPLKDFLLGLMFAEHPEIRKEAQRLLGIYFC